MHTSMLRPLSEQIPRQGLPPDALLALARGLSQRAALDHALDQRRGDLHPDHILWDGGTQVELAEPPRPLAVPSPIPDLSGAAAERAVGFFAPEQLRGEPPTVRSDVFSTGVVLYLAATGEHPFADRDAEAIATNIERYHPPQPGRERRDLSMDWDGLVMICLHKEPPMRFASLLDVEREVERIAAHPLGGTPRRRHRRVDWRRVALALLVVAALVWLLIWLMTWWT
jgi:hypothetical protein